MNVSSIGSTGAFSGVSDAGAQDFRARMQQSMAPVAQLFGMSSEQLMSEVKTSGGSLADYAASKGISNADLTAAVKQGLQSSAPNGVQLSDSQLTNLAQRIENHKPGDMPQGPAVSANAAADNSGNASTIKTDLEKLIADLKALESNSNDTSSTTSTSGSTSSADPTSSGSSMSSLLDLLSRVDSQL
jgi:hypothetical protein